MRSPQCLQGLSTTLPNNQNQPFNTTTMDPYSNPYERTMGHPPTDITKAHSSSMAEIKKGDDGLLIYPRIGGTPPQITYEESDG